MKTSRRGFITLGLTGLGFSWLWKATNKILLDRDILIGGGAFIENGQRQNVISVLDVNSKSYRLTSVNFLPHGFHRHPNDKTRLAVFEKKGLGACEFNLSNREVVRHIRPRAGHYFYGHGAYSADGTVLFSTETNLSTLDGLITIRDASSMDVVGEFPTYGKEPHECKLIDSGRIMVITNGGGSLGQEAPSVTYVDTSTLKLIEKVSLDNPNINAGHLAVMQSGELVVVSAPRRGLDVGHVGGVSISDDNSSLKGFVAPLELLNKLYGEALSIAIHEASGIAAATHPDGNLVTFWSLENQRLISYFEIERPRGIELSADNTHFLLSFGHQTSLLKIAFDNLSFNAANVIKTTFFSGSHIYNVGREAKEFFAPGPFIVS